MKKNKLFWILTVGCVLNFAAHLYFYPSLPDIVPTHWGASGQVNGWGPKSTSTRILRNSARCGTCLWCCSP